MSAALSARRLTKFYGDKLVFRDVSLELAPGAPLSRPLNVIAGHVVSAFAGVALGAILPITWWSIALAVGVAIAAMAGLQILHPPAAGNPIVVMTSAASWPFLLVPILIGAIALVLIAAAFHRATGVAYPLRASSAAAVT